MIRFLQRMLLTLAVGGMVSSASAFSLIGPVDAAFQTAAIGYNPLNTDIGGPMNLAQGYRWNVRTIYYGFDPSFLNYFGTNGVKAVTEALDIINALPTMSKLKDNKLEAYSTDTRRINYRAASLQIIDLKSYTLSTMLEELGLASPERYTFTLRDSRVISGTTYYVVIRRNFDPFTTAPTSYVNDTLYTYAIVDPVTTSGGTTFADAIELPVDPLSSQFTAVVSGIDSLWGFGILPGTFYTGLTRDDVGGLRYLYSKSHVYAENLVSNAVPSAGGGRAWEPYVGTNTNTLVITAFRPGVDRILFKPMPTWGFNFQNFTNSNTDTFYPTNSGKLAKQSYGRAMTQPDVIFAAGDLGLTTGGNPVVISRTASFENDAALNTFTGSGPTAGPGTITPQIVITFSDIGPYLVNNTPNFLDAENSSLGFTWGSFDGSTNEPVVYPVGMTVQDLEQIIFAP